MLDMSPWAFYMAHRKAYYHQYVHKAWTAMREVPAADTWLQKHMLAALCVCNTCRACPTLNCAAGEPYLDAQRTRRQHP